MSLLSSAHNARLRCCWSCCPAYLVCTPCIPAAHRYCAAPHPPWQSEDELSSDEEEPEAWDPSQATPCVKRKKALAAAQHVERGRRSSTGAASSR